MTIDNILYSKYENIDELLNKIYDIDNYTENDVLFEVDDLLDEEDDDQNETDDQQINDDELNNEPSDITGQNDNPDSNINDITPEDILNTNDQNIPETPEIDSGDEQDAESIKDKFLFNLKQLIRIRDLLNMASTKTRDADFTPLIKYVNKVLQTIATIGDSIYEKDNLDEVNKKLEEFSAEVVKQAIEILKKYNSDDETLSQDNQDNDNNDDKKSDEDNSATNSEEDNISDKDNQLSSSPEEQDDDIDSLLNTIG